MIHTPSAAANYQVRIVGADMTLTQLVVRDQKGNLLVNFDLGPGLLAAGAIRVVETTTSPLTITLDCSNDQDGDGIFNQFDIDSDGDGCGDIAEAGVTGATNNGSVSDSILAGAVGANGLNNNLENNDTEGASVNYTSSYGDALNSGMLNCIRLLPIELLYFTGELKSSIVQLNWATATETNNNFFTIEKSKDGENWEQVGNLNGANNSKEKQHYEFTDFSPFQGLSYYRLKQTDFDGQYAYFEILPINYTSKINETLTLHVKDTYVELKSVGFSDTRIEYIKVYNLFGQDISTEIAVNKSNEFNWHFETVNLASGIYIVYANGQSFKFLKK